MGYGFNEEERFFLGWWILCLVKVLIFIFPQIVSGQLSMLKEQCSALIAERLRRGNGFMQVVIIARLQSLAWRIGPMMRTCMNQVILKW